MQERLPPSSATARLARMAGALFARLRWLDHRGR